MTVSHMPACLFYKPWKGHAVTLRWGPYRVGYGMQGDISLVAWQGRTLPVMWMRWCGQMPTGDRIHNLKVFLCVFFFLFFLLLQKPEKQKKNSKALPFCFHVSRSTVVDQFFTKKVCMRLLKSKTIQSTEDSCVLHKAHLCVVAASKE